MKKIKQLKSNTRYVVITRSTSNSCFFDNEKQINLFENLTSTFLKGICKISQSFYTNKGYVLIIKTCSSDSIKKAYLNQREKSNKAKPGAVHEEIWRMISEQFRLLGCSFVKITNVQENRVGTKFCRSYERYEVGNQDELSWLVQFLKFGKVHLDQLNKKYRVDKKIKFWFRYRLTRQKVKAVTLTNKNIVSTKKSQLLRLWEKGDVMVL